MTSPISSNAKYAVEYRDMLTAFHVLAVYADENAANLAFEQFNSGDELEIADATYAADNFVEINFRKVKQDPESGQWYYKGIRDDYIIVNTGHVIPDVG